MNNIIDGQSFNLFFFFNLGVQVRIKNLFASENCINSFIFINRYDNTNTCIIPT